MNCKPMFCCRWLSHRLPLRITNVADEDGVGHVNTEMFGISI